ncbi:flagellar biosynthesis protein FlhB [Lysobacter sp. H21R4]|uniref:flagellar biosynthesis protein FlhB n=1 Tax=Lysobacter sp. H21R4 TaxID=2781021 RepID=UPI001888C344|nr:flagellar biosynthesis protein FlhB [Lysobacter sp. H21R4]QOY63327.1 flagellar biosynthesis protein FlhB [Lysobacter sp. H21R4]
MSGDQEDRTEQPTEKRKREAREKGDVPRSRELANVSVLGVTAVALMVLAPGIGRDAQVWLGGALTVDPTILGKPDRLLTHAVMLVITLVLPSLPILAASLAACLIAPALMSGIRFSGKSLKVDVKRLNPASGLKRIYGKEGFAELLRSLMRVVLVVGTGALVITGAIDDILAMPRMALDVAINTGLHTAMTALLAMAGSLALIAAIDVPWQRHQHNAKLKMTKQEVRDEMKQTEGNPEIKARVRQVARQLSQRQTMEAVPTADVIVMNPTHYAVALKYDADRMRAPRVVAKGVDETALMIRDVAEKHRISVIEAPPLARALYRQAKVDQEIPVKLYAAVAQVLSYVYQLKRWHPAQGPLPSLDLPDVGPDGAIDAEPTGVADGNPAP